MSRLLSCGPLLSTLLVVGCGDAHDGQLSPVANSRTALTECAALSTVSPPDVRITVATGVAASQEPGGVHVAHCKVQGVIGKEIQFEVLLPDEWNGRFVMSGGGGFAGSLENAALFAVSAGYASASTDTGHQATAIQAGWALHNAERLANYGHVAVHRAAETAKAVVAAYYGRNAKYSYFFGCSNGGRQALMEAQRYPQDFDGIVAGAPAYDFTNIAGAFIKNIKAVFPTAGSAATPVVSQDNLALIDRAALEACDAGDGVRDGVIDTPTACRFSLAKVKACAGDVAAADCLTRAQRRTIEAIYAPASDKTREIYPGQPVGAESDDDGWRPWITGVDEELLKGTNGQVSSLQLAFGPEVFKYPRVRGSGVGLHHVRSRRMGERHSSCRTFFERGQSRPRGVQDSPRKADHLARLGRSGAERRQHDRLLPSRPAKGPGRARLREAVPASRGHALRGWARARPGRLDRRARRLGRARQGTESVGEYKARRGQTPDANAAGLCLSATCRLQGGGQYRRGTEFRLQVNAGTKALDRVAQVDRVGQVGSVANPDQPD